MGSSWNETDDSMMFNFGDRYDMFNYGTISCIFRPQLEASDPEFVQQRGEAGRLDDIEARRRDDIFFSRNDHVQVHTPWSVPFNLLFKSGTIHHVAYTLLYIRECVYGGFISFAGPNLGNEHSTDGTSLLTEGVCFVVSESMKHRIPI